MCEFSYYTPIDGREYLFCEKIEEACPYQKYCSTLNKIILNRNWGECKLLIEKIIPKDSFGVLFEKKGFLYVKLKDKTIKVKNTFKEIPEYVYLKEGIEGYECSLVPFEEKKAYSKKKIESNLINDK